MPRQLIRWIVVVFLLTVIATAGWRPLLRYVFPFPYEGAVNELTIRYEMDPLLVAAVIRTESHFKPDATSPKGARGLMQVMPDTALWLNEYINMADFHVDLLYDPGVNITFGVTYLAYLLDLFAGHWTVAVAAYNAGPGNVGRWLETGVWSGTLAGAADIPLPETRQYVQRVTDAYRLYRILYESGHGGHGELLWQEDIGSGTGK